MRVIARSAVRSVTIAVLALLGTVLLAVTTAFTAAITLAATTALIVPGTGTPNPNSVSHYEQNAVDYYVGTTTTFNNGPACAVNCSTVGVPYIAQFWPFPFPGWGGLSGAKWNTSVGSGVTQLNSDLVGPYGPSTDPNSPDKVVVFGYSQGATVASIEKRLLGKLSDDQKSNLAFVLIGNPNRPNGGVFERLALLGTVPILDATFGQPTPTDTNINTTDIAFQYDGVADFPLYPINLLADLNAIAGFWYIHGTYLAPNGNSSPGELPNGLVPADLESIVADAAANCSTSAICQKQGDTTYITIPNKNLPILQPLRDLGAATGTSALTTPLADLVQPVLKVLIETGYDRNLPYGQPAPFRLIPIINPIKLTVDLIDAAGQGIHDALKDIGVTTPALPTPSLPAVPFAKTSQLNLASTNTVGGATLKSASQENLSVTTADTGSGDPKLKSNIRSAKTPVVIKPQRPIIRGPIGSELEKQVKGLVDAATGAFKPPTIKGAAGGKHTVTPGTPGLTEPKDTTTQNTTSQPQDAAA